MDKPKRHKINFKTLDDPEHNTGADRYLITYADLITLLLGLFVILYASSQVDKTKFAEFSEAFGKYFSAKDMSVLEKKNGELSGGKGVLPQPTFSQKEQVTVQQLYSEIEQKLQPFIANGKLSIKLAGNSITVTLPEVLLFQSGKSNILPQSMPVLDSLAVTLKGLPFEIYVDGHTDAIPIKTFQFESNWHLSVDRALNTGYYLIQRGLTEKNVIIRGFGSERPVDDNSTPEGRARNRRVEINITPLSSQTAASIESSKKDTTKH
ncbi:MAG: OmpA family protein [Candidatus Kapaibacteriota bacterium]